ncbi:hypothetical protein D3C76_1289000 [compost metagenome]
MWIDGDPFRPVHFGSSHLRRSLAGEDQHFRLIAETIFRRQAIFTELQRYPAPGTFQRCAVGVPVKLRHI